MWKEIDHRSDLSIKQDDLLASKRFVIEHRPDSVYFYELEEAVVLDVILDETHPEFANAELDTVDWPPNIDGSEPVAGAKNYGIIGKIRFRFLNSEKGKDKQRLNWAYPMENTGISEYPLMNEVVIVGKYMNKFFYSRKLNTKQIVNSNAAFITERINGYVDQNFNIYLGKSMPFNGPTSTMNYAGGKNYMGVLGNYFTFNPNIRAIKRREGDTIIESRFGSSVRFAAYDDNRNNDVGAGGEYGEGAGNPMVLIRNRQAPVTIPQGFTAKGYTIEDINKDGSSIHITSGMTTSAFQPTTTTAIYNGLTLVPLPTLDGDQIVINSDRLVFSSKANEMLFYSKKRIAMATDAEFDFSAGTSATFSVTKWFTINAPQIFLGDHAKIYEPALLGRTTVTWLSAMCDWMLLQVNSQIQTVTALIAHFHMTKLGPTTPPLPPALDIWTLQLTSLQAQQISLLALQSQLSSLMSSRVFVSGGTD
jgi:hypothetical protein